MFKAIFFSVLFYGPAIPAANHFEYQGRLDPEQVEFITPLRRAQYPSYDYLDGNQAAQKMRPQLEARADIVRTTTQAPRRSIHTPPASNTVTVPAQHRAPTPQPPSAPKTTRYAQNTSYQNEVARQKAIRESVNAQRRQQAMGRTMARSNVILPGIIDLIRLPQTDAVDGCAKITKGVLNNGGFLLFTCEKLLPNIPISEHAATYAQYKEAMLADGWRLKPESTKDHAQFSRTDNMGCEAVLDVRLWKDRSMNEPQRPASDRNAHRQIVFMAKFNGAACERYYPIVQALTANR